MKLARAAFVAAVLGVFAVGCGPAIPPAGNYATVQGYARDSSTQQGVAGAVITVNSVQSATTDSNGFFKIAPVPTGPWSYTIAPPSGYTASPSGSDANPPLTSGTPYELDFVLTHH
jgi:hypothetical protein